MNILVKPSTTPNADVDLCESDGRPLASLTDAEAKKLKQDLTNHFKTDKSKTTKEVS